ncbi:MAG: hypothetical protein KF760_30690 [Candidatus Eremiobacteraeota bacterium]|nr:hypothetical protein [Candidatus Eremiobacteraeota bacterium]MCW5868616.1 hypothetical protein [Candidatus Eremiobacteraeota bacterium]
MNTGTVKLTGRDLLWYENRNTDAPAKPRGAWKRHLMVVFALITLKLVAIASSDGVEMLTSWLNDSRGLLGWP